jgi:hypothetical protein
MFPPGKKSQLLGLMGSKFSTNRLGRWAVLTTNTLSIPQQLVKSGCPSSEMSHLKVRRLVVVVGFAVDTTDISAVVIGCVVVVAADVVVVVAVVVVVVVVGGLLDNCSHFIQTFSSLASFGRYTRWTSVLDDGNLK